MKLWKLKFEKYVSKTISESVTHKEITKGLLELPNIYDIKLLKDYVNRVRDESYEKLINFEYNTWINLLDSTFLSDLILNRRQPGEVARLLRASFVK